MAGQQPHHFQKKTRDTIEPPIAQPNTALSIQIGRPPKKEMFFGGQGGLGLPISRYIHTSDLFLPAATPGIALLCALQNSLEQGALGRSTWSKRPSGGLKTC